MADTKFYWTHYRPKMCVYRTGDTPVYSTGIWAESRDHAIELIKTRNIPGEELIDAMASENNFDTVTHSLVEESLLNKKSRIKFNNALHALTFLSFMATCSRAYSIEHILGDGGVLHEFIHVLSNTASMHHELEHILIAVIDLELSVPGYLSTKQVKDVCRYKATLQERIACKA